MIDRKVAQSPHHHGYPMPSLLGMLGQLEPNKEEKINDDHE